MSEITTRLFAQIKKAYYAFERYKVDSTFALLFIEKPCELSKLGMMVRITDHLIPVDANHYFIIFTYTKEDNAYKASQNLILKLDSFFKNETSCIALDSFDINKSPDNVLRRLKQILSVTQQNSYTRIENETILDSY